MGMKAMMAVSQHEVLIIHSFLHLTNTVWHAVFQVIGILQWIAGNPWVLGSSILDEGLKGKIHSWHLLKMVRHTLFIWEAGLFQGDYVIEERDWIQVQLQQRWTRIYIQETGWRSVDGKLLRRKVKGILARPIQQNTCWRQAKVIKILGESDFY